MSTEKQRKKGWGGARLGSGRGAGDKAKICVSVDEDNWQAALTVWKGRKSWLIDYLLANYVDGNDIAQKARAI